MTVRPLASLQTLSKFLLSHWCIFPLTSAGFALLRLAEAAAYQNWDWLLFLLTFWILINAELDVFQQLQLLWWLTACSCLTPNRNGSVQCRFEAEMRWSLCCDLPRWTMRGSSPRAEFPVVSIAVSFIMFKPGCLGMHPFCQILQGCLILILRLFQGLRIWFAWPLWMLNPAYWKGMLISKSIRVAQCQFFLYHPETPTYSKDLIIWTKKSK